ncbi:MAG: hypothetical protein IKT40_03670 [Bacilli bacterium]|nr:hypothetical protein [Bacilli bacterium]
MAIPIHYVIFVYSNDGSTLLKSVSAEGSNIQVNEAGFADALGEYTYNGDKKFLGLATSANATTPTYAIGDSFTINSDTNLYIVEDEANAITDLTNTKWKINSGWLALDSVDLTFNINASLDDSRTIETMRIYTDNFIYFYSYQDGSVYLTNDKSFILNIYGGTDVTNSSLISWLETYGEQIVEEQLKEYTLRIDGVEVTDYENVIVNGVSYKCKKGASVPTDLTGYTVTVPAGWSVSSRYGLFILSYEFNGLVVNEGYLYLGYNIIPGDGPTGAPNYIYIGGSTLTPNDSFLVTFYNGQDVTNSSLIEWFVNNGATFTKAEQEKYFYVKDTRTGNQYQFILPEENITFRYLLNNYGEGLSTSQAYYYNVDNTINIYTATYVLNDPTLTYMYAQPNYGGGWPFDSANLNTIINNGDIFTYTSYEGGGN